MSKGLKKLLEAFFNLQQFECEGYVLSVYECDDGYHGDTQSIFNFEKAQLKHRLNLLEV